MQKTIPYLLVLFSVTLLTGACGLAGDVAGELDGTREIVRGSGNVITAERAVDDFSAVRLVGVGNLVIDRTGENSLSITADDNVLPLVETTVEGDTLVIALSRLIELRDAAELTYNLTVAELDSVTLQGAGTIEVRNLDTERFAVNLPGAGSITAAGRTVEQTVELSGAGSYDGAALESERATVRSNGAGLVVVNVTDELDATISGIGSIEYIGNPAVTENVTGLGAVRQR